jgi:hypothetical protein
VHAARCPYSHVSQHAYTVRASVHRRARDVMRTCAPPHCAPPRAEPNGTQTMPTPDEVGTTLHHLVTVLPSLFCVLLGVLSIVVARRVMSWRAFLVRPSLVRVTPSARRRVHSTRAMDAERAFDAQAHSPEALAETIAHTTATKRPYETMNETTNEDERQTKRAHTDASSVEATIPLTSDVWRQSMLAFARAHLNGGATTAAGEQSASPCASLARVAATTPVSVAAQVAPIAESAAVSAAPDSTPMEAGATHESVAPVASAAPLAAMFRASSTSILPPPLLTAATAQPASAAPSASVAPPPPASSAPAPAPASDLLCTIQDVSIYS